MTEYKIKNSAGCKISGEFTEEEIKAFLRSDWFLDDEREEEGEIIAREK